jgi:hypothetical protein
MIKKFITVLSLSLAINSFAFAGDDQLVISSLSSEQVSSPYDVEVIEITETGIVGDFFGEAAQVANVFEDKGFFEGIGVVTEIIKNPDRRFLAKYPRLRAFVKALKWCFGC